MSDCTQPPPSSRDADYRNAYELEMLRSAEMYLTNFIEGLNRLVAFDAETTGKRTPDAEFVRKQPFAWKAPGIIIEVGFVEMLREGEGWRKGETWSSRVNPDGPINPEAIKIHRIRPADLKNSPRFPTILPKVKDFVGESPIVAHAYKNERDFLDYEFFRVGALAPLNHLGPGELIVEEISLVFVSVGHDRRFSNEVFHFRQDRREPWSVLEIGGPNPVDLDGLGVDWPIRVDPGAPRLALAPALAFAQHFDETDFDDDARGFPGERLLANKLGVGGTLASRLRVEGDEPVETVEEIRQVHRGAPKQRQFVPVSVIGVTASDRMTLRFRKPD